MKTCLECGEKIVGREDKKFCSDGCRNAYNNKINKELNWYPMTSFKDGLKQTIDFYKNLL